MKKAESKKEPKITIHLIRDEDDTSWIMAVSMEGDVATRELVNAAGMVRAGMEEAAFTLCEVANVPLAVAAAEMERFYRITRKKLDKAGVHVTKPNTEGESNDDGDKQQPRRPGPDGGKDGRESRLNN